jgi:spermidine/putrescine transport system substrate-binding protein
MGTPDSAPSAPLLRGLTRRRFLGGVLGLGSAAALSACSTPGLEKYGLDARAATDLSSGQKVVNWSNWPEYVDVNDKTQRHPSLDQFKKATGITVRYTEDVTDNDVIFAKLKPALAAGRDTGRDLVVVTDWMAARWIRSGYVVAFDKKNIPNAKNLQPTLASPKFDPKRQYTMPWQSGMTAIGYNPDKTGRKLSTVKDLFDPKFKGHVTMLSDWRDSASLVLLSQGKKTGDATVDEIKGAIEELQKQSDNGQIRKFTGNDYTRGLASGDLWACTAYSGDVVQLQADNPKLEFLIPDEGAIIWTDNMMIPQKPPHIYAAETMINFVDDPVVAAKIAAYVNYVTPVVGAKEELAKTDPDTADNQLIFPSEATLEKLQPYPGLSTEEERELTEMMQQVAGA